MLVQSRHALPLRQVLANQPVGVLVAASLPRVIRPREVEGNIRALLDPFVIVELGPVVSRHGREGRGVAADETDDSSIQRGGRPIPQLPDQEQPTPALDEAHDAVLAAGSHHGIDLPMPGLLPRLDLRRPLGDMALPGQFSTAIVAAVTLSSPLAGAPQVGVEESSLPLILPDVPVDGLVADQQLSGSAQVA